MKNVIKPNSREHQIDENENVAISGTEKGTRKTFIYIPNTQTHAHLFTNTNANTFAYTQFSTMSFCV